MLQFRHARREVLLAAKQTQGGGSEVNGRCLEALLERLHDAVAFVDRSGGILLTNRVEELSALPPSVHMTELGETFEIFRPDGRPYQTTEWPVLRAARTGEVIVDEEFFRLLPDGSRRSFSCDCAPFYDDRGAIAGAVLGGARRSPNRSARRSSSRTCSPCCDHTEDAMVACDAQWHITAVESRRRADVRLDGRGGAWTPSEFLAARRERRAAPRSVGGNCRRAAVGAGSSSPGARMDHWSRSRRLASRSGTHAGRSPATSASTGISLSASERTSSSAITPAYWTTSRMD